MMLSAPIVAVFNLSEAYGAEEDGSVLLDMGNGNTLWYDAESGTTIGEVIKNTVEANGHTYSDIGFIKIDGVSTDTIGSVSTGGSFILSGTTGYSITSQWNIFLWDVSSDKWETVSDITETYRGEDLAIGYYPISVVPVETPEYKSSWTMIRGDAEQTGAQDDVVISDDEVSIEWELARGGKSGVLSSALYVEDKIFVKFSTKDEKAGEDGYPVVYCLELNGDEVWKFSYPGVDSYESTTPLIVGNYIYVSSADGFIYKMPWREGPGNNNENVTSFNGKTMVDLNEDDAIPYAAGPLTEFSYKVGGTSSLIYDSGAIYCASINGMVYCFDLDLNLVWSSQMGGSVYYVSPTVYGDYVFSGALNGHLYVFYKKNGGIVASEKVYTRNIDGKEYGNVSAISVIDRGSKYTLIFSVSDGRGMSSVVGGVGVYDFDLSTEKLKKISLFADKDIFGLTGNYHISMNTDDFKGTYFTSTKGLWTIDVNGNYKKINGTIASIKSPPLLVNGESVYLMTYAPSNPIYEMSLDGEILSEWYSNSKVKNYSMSPVLFVGGMMIYGNDAGLVAMSGTLPEYVPPVYEEKSLLETLIEIALIILLILVILYLVLRFVFKIKNPFGLAWRKFIYYLTGEDLKHNTKSRHKLYVMLLAGLIITIIVFVICLCVGPTVTLSVSEMFSSLSSALSKGGQGLTYNELMVYESRLPRTIAALAVGIGLSIAGSMYQAIIRNPLVDPYIMGVSAGAGTAALAVIAFDFTFFGLFSPHSIYLTAFTAIVGGILAFAITMLIAEKSGGTSINYVLAGVVVGLAFSAIQTLMLSMSGQKVSNALSWLFGSFANVSWDEVWLILVPVVMLSLIPLIWAKEFNLVLLGEDQAQQMGLNVRRFNRLMLIMASVLTSFCVAFVGIIGFVGLVVPHVCRMILGSDHRLVLPASITLGGALVMLADLASRMLYYGQELPVGAITTIIGVPVFAYLLIRRGRMYEG